MAFECLHMMDDAGETPLDRVISSGHREIAEMLLNQERGDHPDAGGSSTALHKAAAMGLTEAVESLLHFGGDAAAMDRYGETPLHKAVCHNHPETVRVLLGASDPNAMSVIGLTPLHWASIRGDVRLAELLVAHGANPWTRDEYIDGLTPFELAEMMGHEALIAAYEGVDILF